VPNKSSSTLESLAKQKVEERAKCKLDKMYLSKVLGYDFVEDTHNELFANYLQIKPGVPLLEQDTVKDRMVLWSRGHYKTSSIVVEAIQLILNFPDIRILLMQGTVKNTMGLLKEIKSHFIGEFHGSRLSEVFPEFCAEKLGTRQYFTVPARIRKGLKEATVTVASPKTVKAGQHYDAGFFDDLVNEQNYRNPTLVQKAIDDFNHYTPLIDPGYYKYVTGTRYVFGDLYEWIITKSEETKSWAISVKQCWTVNPDGSRTILFPQCKSKDGRTIGFTLEMLEKIQKEDPEMFSAQYLNQPAAADRQRFSEIQMLAQLRIADHPEYPVANPMVLFIDLAASRQRYSDHSVILAGRADRLGRVWVADMRGNKYASLELAEAVMEMTMIHRPSKVLIEGTSAGKFFVDYLKVIAAQKNMFLPLDFIKVDTRDGAKEMRISALEGELKNNRLFFLFGLPNWDRLLKEFVNYYPGRRHDDYPDTVALMVQYFQQNTPQVRMPSILDHPMFRQELTNNSLITSPPRRDEGLGSDFNCG
jgi:phage terminase large subunit-like protein